ncbi:hypothetical protein [Exiguobacterium sp. s193]|uniref:hypothetical protein n=1 Tax=Exiguobacterium sp. s193 TaxID=2751207 RepID=UPI001BE5BF89|nr:hypothetical protein [Exiguobacterium sp. s193]
MSKQLMQYSIQKNGKEINEGIIMAEGASVYEMTEDVVGHLGEMYDLTEIEFVDVSNTWTFSGILLQSPITLEIAPIDTPADKFGVDEEVN